MAVKTGTRRPYAARMPEAERRDQLLDAALSIVVSRGHGAATMGNVATQAGVTRPVVYGIFADREELLAALLDRESSAAAQQVIELSPGVDIADLAVALEAGLPDLAEQFLRSVRAAPARWFCIVMQVPGMPVEFHAARDAVRSRIVDTFAAAVARYAPDADAVLTAEMLVGMLEWAARMTLTQPGDYPPERFTAALRPISAMFGAIGA
ncbi:TetR/AcrR family transcriptional regulator [Gordonia sp. CPCC 205333]|uniref:TetR/AcrR family transcriptional regulator n=1 Tax=Gordonia sp. CPCC 205333 TaxID=3140790 RepID=UPI003AF33180